MLLPVSLKNRLEKQLWYLRLRYSSAVIKTWLLLRQDAARDLKKQRALYQSLLPSGAPQLVFDVGAHEGFITQLFADLGYRVIAIEPSRRNVSILQTRFLNESNIIILPTALSDHQGSDHFFESSSGHAFGTFSRKWKAVREEVITERSIYHEKPVNVGTTTLDALIELYGVPAFIKTDVEGYEETVLKGLTRKVPLLSFEAILPHFLKETISSIEHLCSLCTDVVFNYALNYRMVHASFIKKEELLAEIGSVNGTIEVFCRMKFLFP